jgi:hypothetical protein
MNSSNDVKLPAGGTNRIYRRLLPSFRRRRMRLCSDLLHLSETTRVLDVGGTDLNWQWCQPRPDVTIVNLDGGDLIADGRCLPVRDQSFDVVFSNSVIEHVGGPQDQKVFAAEVARVGRHFFVQTPNRYFPIEPHFLAPFVQFLPIQVRAVVVRKLTPWGVLNRPPRASAINAVRSIHLLTPRQVRQIFPTGHVVRERFLGLTKSLVAVRTERAA